MPNEADPKIDSNKTQKVSAYPTLGVLLLLCGSLWGQMLKVNTKCFNCSGRSNDTCWQSDDKGNITEVVCPDAPNVFRVDSRPKPEPEDVPAIQEKHFYPMKTGDDDFSVVSDANACMWVLKGDFVSGKGCTVTNWRCEDGDRVLIISFNGKKAWCHLPQEAKP